MPNVANVQLQIAHSPINHTPTALRNVSVTYDLGFTQPEIDARANFHVNVSGTHVVDNGQDVVNRDRNLTVSGLEGAETSRSWSGTGTRNDNGSRTISGVMRS